jgi:hypothetical protein
VAPRRDVLSSFPYTNVDGRVDVRGRDHCGEVITGIDGRLVAWLLPLEIFERCGDAPAEMPGEPPHAEFGEDAL